MGHVIAGRYDLIDMFARGGMGSVWVARDLRDGELVAVKLLHAVEATDLLRFVREAGLRLGHPHVAAPLGWVAEDDQVAFAMPLVRGGSVADLVRGYGPLPAPFVAEVLRQLLTALEHVHAQGWIHRDIKPGNLLLDPCRPTERPHVRLTDFGIAVEADAPRLTMAEDAGEVGTPGYMPPERSSRTDPAPAADLYAVGVTAMVILTGRRPAEGALDHLDTLPALRAVVEQLMAADPSVRFGSARDARLALEDPELAWPEGGAGVFVPDVVTSEVPTSAESATSDPAPRRRGRSRWIALGLAVLMVGGVGAAWATLSLRDGSAEDSSTESTSTSVAAPLTSRWAAGRVRAGRDCSAEQAKLLSVTEGGGVAACTATSESAGEWKRTDSAPVSKHAVLTEPAADPRWSSSSRREGADCDHLGEYAVATGGSWLLRCNGSQWTAEAAYPTGDGEGVPGSANYRSRWTDARAPFGEECTTRGQLMVTKAGYPALCTQRPSGELAWMYEPDQMPVHPTSDTSTPPSKPPRWSERAEKSGDACSVQETYAVAQSGWLLRCRGSAWAWEGQYPLPPSARATGSS